MHGVSRKSLSSVITTSTSLKKKTLKQPFKAATYQVNARSAIRAIKRLNRGL